MIPRYVEEFGSIQGEGPFAGTPSIFIRMSKCTLRCPWCDTKYAWKEDGVNLLPKVAKIAKSSKINHVVITGGEPTIYIDNETFIEYVQKQLEANMVVTFETTTIGKIQYLRSSHILTVLEHYDSKFKDFKERPHYVVSPKFDMKAYPSDECFTIETILEYYNLRNLDPNKEFSKRLHYKFVYEDRFKKEILNLISEMPDWFVKNYVYVMPYTPQNNVEEYKFSCLNTVNFCIQNGLKYSPRLHVDLWGYKRGV